MSGWKRGFLIASCWMIITFLLAPVFVVFPVSLTDRTYLSLPENAISFAHWSALIEDPKWLSAFYSSLFIACISTLIAVICGSLCAIGCWRRSSWVTTLIRALVLVPLIIPVVVYALGLFRFYSGLGLLDSYFGIILAHAAIGTPYVFLTTSAALTDFDRRWERAARSLGANWSQTIRWVIAPVIKPGILVGAVFAFMNSWDELVVVLFIASRRVTTLPRVMWDGIHEQLDPSIAAVATLLILATVVLLAPVIGWRAKQMSSG